MVTLTEVMWKLNPPGGLFDEAVVAANFPHETPAAPRNLLYCATRAGEVADLRRGLYSLAEPFRTMALDPRDSLFPPGHKTRPLEIGYQCADFLRHTPPEVFIRSTNALCVNPV